MKYIKMITFVKNIMVVTIVKSPEGNKGHEDHIIKVTRKVTEVIMVRGLT